MTLLPPEVSLAAALALLAFSFFTSAITATFGLGGGVIMLAGLGLVFPPAVLVPVHGLVQLGSNAGRAIVQRAHIHWQTAIWFCLGAIPGSLVGAQVALALPETLFMAVIAIFVLYSTWAPQPRIEGRGPVANFVGGTIISGLGMIVGASGLLVANFIKWLADRRQIIATQALLVSVSNAFKVIVFAAFGFAFSAYMPLVVAMIATGFAGTLVGSRLLDRLPEAGFRTAFRIVLTLMAIKLLLDAIW